MVRLDTEYFTSLVLECIKDFVMVVEMLIFLVLICLIK